jgi:hypothetical protein
MPPRRRIWQELTWSWAYSTGNPASDQKLEAATKAAWPYAILCAWTFLNDHDAAHDLMDYAVQNTSHYVGRHPDCPDKKLTLHLKSVIKRRARQQSAKRSREIQYGSLIDLEKLYIGHRCFLLGLLPLPLPLNWQRHVTYMPNATWRRRGVATARGGGSPTLGTKRSGSGKGGGLHKRSAEAWGYPLRARGAELPLAAFAVVVAVALQAIREGRCGEGTAPLRRVAEDCKAGRRQGGYFRPTKTAFRKSGSIVCGQFDRIEL